MPSKRERKLISKNRSAHHEYFIDETFECGIELSGTEVKSIRERACQITDTFALIRGGECWLVGLHIHPYSHGGVWNRDPDRRRRLLLHRKEIDFLDGKLRNRGYALVPLELYFNTDADTSKSFKRSFATSPELFFLNKSIKPMWLLLIRNLLL